MHKTVVMAALRAMMLIKMPVMRRELDFISRGSILNPTMKNKSPTNIPRNREISVSTQ